LILTPLGFIKGYATTLLREVSVWDESTRREFLTIIDEESDRLHDLIDNLMDSSRLQSGTLSINTQPLRLDTLLRDIKLRATTRNEGLDIRVETRSTGLQIQGDPARLVQVFENLISNAGKYAPDSPITISADADDSFVHIHLSDQGPGIAPEYLGRLFTRFYRVPRGNLSVRGSGLGLYICRQIIDAHRGSISVESTVNQGTTFSIHLPCKRVQGDGSPNREERA
jgi:signal transduction histidine kinase